MSNITLYVTIIIILTIIFIFVYYCQENHHQYQIEKIKTLESIYKQKEKELNALKLQSKSCIVQGLNDPRSCYFGSNYQCSWNDSIGRCDMIT